jgi:hypothetical protein
MFTVDTFRVITSILSMKRRHFSYMFLSAICFCMSLCVGAMCEVCVFSLGQWLFMQTKRHWSESKSVFTCSFVYFELSLDFLKEQILGTKSDLIWRNNVAVSCNHFFTSDGKNVIYFFNANRLVYFPNTVFTCCTDYILLYGFEHFLILGFTCFAPQQNQCIALPLCGAA